MRPNNAASSLSLSPSPHFFFPSLSFSATNTRILLCFLPLLPLLLIAHPTPTPPPLPPLHLILSLPSLCLSDITEAWGVGETAQSSLFWSKSQSYLRTQRLILLYRRIHRGYEVSRFGVAFSASMRAFFFVRLRRAEVFDPSAPFNDFHAFCWLNFASYVSLDVE